MLKKRLTYITSHTHTYIHTHTHTHTYIHTHTYTHTHAPLLYRQFQKKSCLSPKYGIITLT